MAAAIHFGRTVTQAAAVPGVETVIPGHSTLMTLADLREYGAFMSDIAT